MRILEEYVWLCVLCSGAADRDKALIDDHTQSTNGYFVPLKEGSCTDGPCHRCGDYTFMLYRWKKTRDLPWLSRSFRRLQVLWTRSRRRIKMLRQQITTALSSSRRRLP